MFFQLSVVPFPASRVRAKSENPAGTYVLTGLSDE
jgi:hypothetical protein